MPGAAVPCNFVPASSDKRLAFLYMKYFLINPLLCLAVVGAVFSLSSCDKATADPDPDFTTGKNNFTLTIDGVVREYVVHIPAVYTGTTAVPVVIFCHGGGQTGEQFYNIAGWKEVGDTANIITVYPTALTYCVTEDGNTQTSTKWNNYAGGSEFCPGQRLQDDVKFMQQMISAVKDKYNVDPSRIYMVGFSNGGQFAATCAIQISNILAAVVSCGGGGSFPRDTVFTPVRKLPVMLMFGNEDAKMVKALGLPAGSAVPMGFDLLYSTYPQLYFAQPKPYINNFKLDETHYTTSGNNNPIAIADYVGLSGDPNNVFKMVEVKGLEHEYPNGINYPINGAVYHWNWLKNFKLP